MDRHPKKTKYTFHPPDIPRERWCDFRVEFENGKTLKEISNKYNCDPRTVRHCIILNKSSYELGKQFSPTKLEPFTDLVQELYHQFSSSSRNGLHIVEVSRTITSILAEQGYQGSERTVRNYLRKEFQNAYHQNNP